MPAYRGKRAAGNSAKTVLLAGAAVLAVLAAAGAFWLRGPGAQAGNPVQTDSGSGLSSMSEPSSISGPDSSSAQPDSSGTHEALAPAYDFSQPAPEREAVDNSYFEDAAFVGDSRTDGFMLYSGIGTGTNLTSNGLSVFTLPAKEALTINGESYTLLEALALEQYGKVYISLGVNELGIFRDDDFYASYCAAIDEIRRVQPSAVIYIQGLIPLNETQIEEYNGNRFNLTNEHLRVYNDLMRRAAEEKQVVFLDLYAQFVDENGELPRESSRDGVHLVKEACQQWLEYLKTHTVDFDTLYPDGPPAAEPISMEDGSEGA